jgi:hypothetical protein
MFCNHRVLVNIKITQIGCTELSLLIYKQRNSLNKLERKFPTNGQNEIPSYLKSSIKNQNERQKFFL